MRLQFTVRLAVGLDQLSHTVHVVQPWSWPADDKNVIRVRFVPGFKFGEDVVLLAFDSAGLVTFLATLSQAVQLGSSRLDHDGRVHEFLIEPGTADVELHDDRVVWRMDHGKAIEIIERLRVLQGGGPGHHYVDDMSSPAPTLVLSRDEYISPSWLTAGKEPLFGNGPQSSSQ